MTKGELYQYLVNGDVAQDWWSLDYATRRALAVRIAKKWSKDYFCTNALGIAKGQVPPTHNGWYDKELNLWGQSPWGMEFASAYRAVLLSSIAPSNVPRNFYWWKFMGPEIDSEDTEQNVDGNCKTCVWKCYEPGVRFGLPAAVAIGGCDWLNCLQVSQDVGSLTSWVFFQLWETDAYPGCHSFLWPPQYDSIAIHNVSGVHMTNGYTQLGSKIVEIQY
jgi:hypothetical protein